MKKYLLPSALILLLGLGFGFAQNINKALQLSQDATGAFAVDTNNGVYFPGHILSPTKGAILPTVTSGGTNTPSISGTDFAGQVVFGTTATSASVVFGTAYLSIPWCVVTWQGSGSSVTPTSYNPFTTGIIMAQGSTSGNKVNYLCSSAS